MVYMHVYASSITQTCCWRALGKRDEDFHAVDEYEIRTEILMLARTLFAFDAEAKDAILLPAGDKKNK